MDEVYATQKRKQIFVSFLYIFCHICTFELVPSFFIILLYSDSCNNSHLGNSLMLSSESLCFYHKFFSKTNMLSKLVSFLSDRHLVSERMDFPDESCWFELWEVISYTWKENSIWIFVFFLRFCVVRGHLKSLLRTRVDDTTWYSQT